MTVCCRTTVGERTVYLETSRDITSIFQEREMQFDTYTEWSIVLLLLSAIVMLAVSMFLTRPLARLSATTRRIAEEDYDVRMRVKGEDEIAEFTRDFNAMTDAVQDKMYDLDEHGAPAEDSVASSCARAQNAAHIDHRLRGYAPFQADGAGRNVSCLKLYLHRGKTARSAFPEAA